MKSGMRRAGWLSAFLLVLLAVGVAAVAIVRPVWVFGATSARQPSRLETLAFFAPALASVGAYVMRANAAAMMPGGSACAPSWTMSVASDAPYQYPFFPEIGAQYHLLAIGFPEDGGTVAHIEGAMPRMRYGSFQAYRLEDGSLIGGISDLSFARDASRFRVEIAMAPEGSSAPVTVQRGRLNLPAGSRRVLIVYRTYLMQTSGVALPSVTIRRRDGSVPDNCQSGGRLFSNAMNGNALPMLLRIHGIDHGRQRESLAAGKPWPIRFRAYDGARAPFLGNGDSWYAAGVFEPSMGAYALFRIRPPGASASAPKLRFWSLCVSGVRETSTSQCLFDEAITTGADGYVRVLVGPPDPAVDANARRLHVNRMGWGSFLGPRMLILRQIYGDADRYFPASLTRIPDASGAADPGYAGLYADTVMGEDAPLGRYCSREKAAGLTPGCF